MPFDCRLKHPFTMQIVGPSGIGKTTFLYKLLKAKRVLMHPAPPTVLLYFSENQPLFGRMLNEGLVQAAYSTLPDYDEMRGIAKKYKKNGGALIIFDDCMHAIDTPNFELIFSQLSHHANASFISVQQTLFNSRSKNLRIASLNTKYLVLFKFPRDNSQVYHLGRQFRPTDPSFLFQCYQRMTKAKFAYLFIDYDAASSDAIRVRSRVLPSEKPMLCFIPLGN